MADLQPTPARLEAFSDGVIAVIITIMVLELKVPADNGPAGFYAVVPTILVYLLSFANTGIYWLNHHHLIDRLKRVDELVLYSNLIYLFFLSLIPFFTNYVLVKSIDSFSVLLYAASMIVTGFAFGLLRFSVNRLLCRSGELGLTDILTQRKHMVSLLIYLTAIPLAYWKPRVAMLEISFVTLLWVVPTLGVRTARTEEFSPR